MPCSWVAAGGASAWVWLLVTSVLLGAATVAALGFAHTAPVVLLIAIVVPIFTNVYYACTSLVLQGLAPADMRGRVLGLNGLVAALALPIGQTTTGWLGSAIGVQEALIVLGVTMIVLTSGLVVARASLYRLRTAMPATESLPDPVVAM